MSFAEDGVSFTGSRGRRSGTLVLLHGFTGGPADFAALPLEGLGLCRYAPWLSGHGPDPDRSAEDFDDELERLIARIDELEEPRHLLGYSMGARVGLGLAVRYPEVWSSATLIGVNPGLESSAARRERKAWEDGWIRLLEQDGLPVFEHHWSRLPLFATQARLPEAERARQQRARLSHTAAGLAHALRVLGLAAMPDLWSHLPLIPFPVCLVAGAADARFLELADRAAEGLLDARVVEVEGVGHNALLEAPRAIAHLLRETIALAPQRTSLRGGTW
jgi:2-succinyl-6-hydroxy-2,4-cyclohexadiene-1-carboxylate synthase